jgi:hypothetical protein
MTVSVFTVQKNCFLLKEVNLVELLIHVGRANLLVLFPEELRDKELNSLTLKVLPPVFQQLFRVIACPFYHQA